MITTCLKGETMNSDNVVCPHCGYRSEDDELCVACGKFIHEDDHVAVRNVSTLGILGSGLRSLFNTNNKGVLKDDEQDHDYDPSWSILSSNIYHENE